MCIYISRLFLCLSRFSLFFSLPRLSRGVRVTSESCICLKCLPLLISSVDSRLTFIWHHFSLSLSLSPSLPLPNSSEMTGSDARANVPARQGMFASNTLVCESRMSIILSYVWYFRVVCVLVCVFQSQIRLVRGVFESQYTYFRANDVSRSAYLWVLEPHTYGYTKHPVPHTYVICLS